MKQIYRMEELFASNFGWDFIKHYQSLVHNALKILIFVSTDPFEIKKWTSYPFYL